MRAMIYYFTSLVSSCMHTYDMLLIENQKHGHGFLLLPPSVASVLAPVASVHTGYGYGESGRPTVSIKSALGPPLAGISPSRISIV